MAKSVLIVYKPLDKFGEKSSYWNDYIIFYEQYWDSPASPYGIWSGKEYEDFKQAISKYLDINEEEIEDCFFIKDKEDRYYLSPIGSEIKPYLLYSANYIPLHWFILFKDEESKFFIPILDLERLITMGFIMIRKSISPLKG